jgi:hypothetical protein
MISTILFDMNDVLYSYDRSVRVARIARICREPAAAVAEAIWESGFEASGDSGVHGCGRLSVGFWRTTGLSTDSGSGGQEFEISSGWPVN